MRAFVAIDLPDPVRDALVAVQEALPVGRPSDPDQLHLTLAFLGEQPDEVVEAAHWALTRLSGPPFDLQLSGLGTFGDRAPSTVWAGVRDPAALKALQARVLSALHGAGLMLERRRFRPHVTLARLGRLQAAEEERLARFLSRFGAFPSPPFRVGDLGLWRSTLHRSGAVHDELARYPLG
jgi:2'-5' RNA ligase